MTPERGLQGGGRIGHSVAVGPLEPGRFGKLIGKRPHRPVEVSGGCGKPDPEVQRAAMSVALQAALPFRQPPDEIPAQPMQTGGSRCGGQSLRREPDRPEAVAARYRQARG